jgi:hypothetical protein
LITNSVFIFYFHLLHIKSIIFLLKEVFHKTNTKAVEKETECDPELEVSLVRKHLGKEVKGTTQPTSWRRGTSCLFATEGTVFLKGQEDNYHQVYPLTILKQTDLRHVGGRPLF